MVRILKRFAYGETRYAAVMLGPLLGGVLWAFGTAGLFAVPDGVLYDYLVRMGRGSSQALPKVLLLDAQPESRDGGDATWLPLLKELQSQGADQVLFTFLPAHVTPDFYAYARSSGNVFFGRRLIQPTGVLTEALEIESLPKAAQEKGMLSAVYALAPSEYGVYRIQAHAFATSADPASPALESLAAAYVRGGVDKLQKEGLYRVSFLGSYELPRISATRVANGELIPELVKGRSVLIGFAGAGPHLYTPLAGSGRMLSELEFHGYALDTLLRDQPIGSVPNWVRFPMILSLIGFSLFILQWGGLRFAVGVTAILVVANGIMAWLALDFARVWLPLTELWLAQIATFFLFTRVRAVTEETKLRRMMQETNAKLRERFFPASFSASQEHWSQVIAMVNQTLNLERVIFLERVKGDHRVREVKSLNCSLQDIKEQRRDYERAPYSTAIAERSPIEVKDYLSRGADGEVQYLVPLLFGGEILGFWAFGARPEKLAALHNRDAVLRDFGEQIAELLFYRQQWLAKEAEASRPLERYLRLQGGEQVVESLEKTLAALDRRLAGMEDYLHGLSTAGILYDLFGRVLIVNRQMMQILTKAKLAPYQMTVADLVSAVAGVRLDHARGLIQSIILDRQKISISAKLPDDQRSYVLYLGPLLPDRQNQGVRTADPRPFELEGVLCELIDVTAIKRLCYLKDEVAERLVYQVRNDTASLLMAVSLLEIPALTEEKRSRAISIARDKISNMMMVTEKTHGLLSQEVNIEAETRYPVDCKQPLHAAVDALESKAASHGIRFDLNLPDLISLVFASPEGLKAVLESILAALITDTIQQGGIRVDLEERDQWIVYRFSSQGFGMPEERFQAYLHGDASLSTEEFRNLRQSAVRVEHWGGALEGHSEIGVGTRLELKLKGFI